MRCCVVAGRAWLIAGRVWNSDELAALGMKKKSEYKSPKRRKPGDGGGGQSK